MLFLTSSLTLYTRSNLKPPESFQNLVVGSVAKVVPSFLSHYIHTPQHFLSALHVMFHHYILLFQSLLSSRSSQDLLKPTAIFPRTPLRLPQTLQTIEHLMFWLKKGANQVLLSFLQELSAVLTQVVSLRPYVVESVEVWRYLVDFLQHHLPPSLFVRFVWEPYLRSPPSPSSPRVSSHATEEKNDLILFSQLFRAAKIPLWIPLRRTIRWAVSWGATLQALHAVFFSTNTTHTSLTSEHESKIFCKETPVKPETKPNEDSITPLAPVGYVVTPLPKSPSPVSFAVEGYTALLLRSFGAEILTQSAWRHSTTERQGAAAILRITLDILADFLSSQKNYHKPSAPEARLNYRNTKFLYSQLFRFVSQLFYKLSLHLFPEPTSLGKAERTVKQILKLNDPDLSNLEKLRHETVLHTSSKPFSLVSSLEGWVLALYFASQHYHPRGENRLLLELYDPVCFLVSRSGTWRWRTALTLYTPLLKKTENTKLFSPGSKKTVLTTLLYLLRQPKQWKAGLRLYMRYGPSWATPSLNTSSLNPNSHASVYPLSQNGCTPTASTTNPLYAPTLALSRLLTAAGQWSLGMRIIAKLFFDKPEKDVLPPQELEARLPLYRHCTKIFSRRNLWKSASHLLSHLLSLYASESIDNWVQKTREANSKSPLKDSTLLPYIDTYQALHKLCLETGICALPRVIQDPTSRTLSQPAPPTLRQYVFNVLQRLQHVDIILTPEHLSTVVFLLYSPTSKWEFVLRQTQTFFDHKPSEKDLVGRIGVRGAKKYNEDGEVGGSRLKQEENAEDFETVHILNFLLCVLLELKKKGGKTDEIPTEIVKKIYQNFSRTTSTTHQLLSRFYLGQAGTFPSNYGLHLYHTARWRASTPSLS